MSSEYKNENAKTYRCVYGPVPSRRLGRSLGVDLIPFKTCTYDCIYCQLGRTTNKTTKLDEYVLVESVLAEIGDKLKEEPQPDFIGLAGCGEPTLHIRLGEIISGVKELTDIPVAVLTNGSLLWKPEVRSALSKADLIIPSLDAGTPSSFARVNRPHAELSFERMVDGLLAFSHEAGSRIWLEVLLLAGITDRPEELERIAAIVDKMRIDRVQLNTVSRPPADASALTVSIDSLNKFRDLFSCPCEVIAESPRSQPLLSSSNETDENQIVALLRRRPCTVEGISVGLGLRPNEVLKHLDVLCAKGVIRTHRKSETVFYEGVHPQ